ncbi:MAG TPA: hypothetical protein VGF30_10615 [Bacteroidia bacterium]
MNATATHYLSKDEVSEKLKSLQYTFQESYWESFVESYNPNRFSSPKAPAVKLSPKLLAIPVSIAIVSTIIYFSISNLKSQNGTDSSINKTSEAAILPANEKPETSTATKEETKPAEPLKSTATPPVSTPSVAASTIKSGPAPQKKEETKPVVSAARIINPEQPKVKEQVTVTPENNNSAPKKKKRRKQDNAGTENAFIPSPEDDNIVVPSN